MLRGVGGTRRLPAVVVVAPPASSSSGNAASSGGVGVGVRRGVAAQRAGAGAVEAAGVPRLPHTHPPLRPPTSAACPWSWRQRRLLC